MLQLNTWSGNVFCCRRSFQPRHHPCQAQETGRVVSVSSSRYLQTYLFTSLDTRAFPSLYYLLILKNQPRDGACRTDGIGISQHQHTHHRAPVTRSPFCPSTNLHVSCWIHNTQKLGHTAETQDRWSQLFAKQAEKVPPPPWAAAALPSCGMSTRLPDLLGSEPAPGGLRMPSASQLLDTQKTDSTSQGITSEICQGTCPHPSSERRDTRTSVQLFLAQNQPLAAYSLLALPQPWQLAEQDPYRKTQTAVVT